MQKNCKNGYERDARTSGGKRKVAQATSWIGLEKTAEYQNYKNSHLSNFLQYQYITVFKSIEVLDAKSTCL